MSILAFLGVSASTDRDPTSGFWYGPAGARSTAGVDVNENTAMNFSGAWAATRLLCATGSCLPLNLRRRTGKKSNEVALDHDVQRVIHNQFNPEMGSMMGRSYGINMQVNRGNFYAEIVWKRDRKGTGLKELWPIHESRVKVGRDEGGQLAYEVRNDDGSKDTFSAEEMFHVPSIISSNGIQGKGVIQNARESLGAALATEKHGASFFGNGAMPGIIIKGGKFKDKGDREDYRRQWMEVHGGPSNGMKPALLPEGADVSFLSFNARDSQFLELREHNITEMARWYGVPPHMIYDLRRATYSNIEHQGIDFVVYSLIPWLKLWEEEIWRKLLTEEEQKTYFAKHAVEGLLRGDSQARSSFYTALFNIGVLSINDILELEDRNDIGEDGDKRFVPLNMTTIEKAGEEPLVKALPTPVDDEDEVEPPDETTAKLIEFSTGEQIVAAPKNDAIVSRCREVLSETLSRMLKKEAHACRDAADQHQPEKFYAWLDDYYGRYSETLTAAIGKHVEIYMLSSADARDPQAVIAENVTKHIEASKEDILRATEVAADKWGTVPDRIAACGVRWQTERTAI